MLTLDSLDLTPEQRQQVDDLIVTGYRVLAVKVMCDASACPLRDAIEILGSRHLELREIRPDDFAEDIETWGRGFYS